MKKVEIKNKKKNDGIPKNWNWGSFNETVTLLQTNIFYGLYPVKCPVSSADQIEEKAKDNVTTLLH